MMSKYHFIVRTLSLLLLFCGSMVAMAAEIGVKYSFAAGKWQADDWLQVKSPRWDYRGEWEQRDDHIVNRVPAGSPEDLQGKLAPQTYTSMILKKQFSGSAVISARMEFDYRMAPLIVIAPTYGADAQGRPEYREHWEIVLYDKGINVWHHYYRDGKPSWRKAAALTTTFKPGVPYRLEVKLEFAASGCFLTVTCGDHTFGYHDDNLPKNYYVGITGCEGSNRFYDFTIEKTQP